MYVYPKEVYDVIEKGNPLEIRQLFAITDDNLDTMAEKFNLWAKTFFPNSFKVDDADFHYEMNQNLSDLYVGRLLSLAQIHFRGASKTSRTKIFIAFILCNDQRESRRKYIKILAEDGKNSTQMVTDIYNMLVSQKVKQFYSHLFTKTDQKREETKSAFDLATGVKVLAGTLGQDQRGHLQGEDNTRPDFIVFEDFETSKTIMSIAVSTSIWKSMEEAWNGKAVGGVGLYNCNYISKRRNVQKIIDRAYRSPTVHKIHIVPIKDKQGNSNWASAFPLSAIRQIELDAEDFEGEYMCNPSGNIDSFFSEKHLMRHPTMNPILTTRDGWQYFFKQDPKHQYLIGIDPSGGTGGNFGTIVVIDWTLRMVVAHFRSRFIQADDLAKEGIKKAILYNNALIVPEMNYQGLAMLRVFEKEKYTNIYVNQFADEDKDKKGNKAIEENKADKIGFTTTSQSKSTILTNLSTALKQFYLLVPSAMLKKELVEFPREYVELVKADDEELGHFDLTMALALAWEGRTQLAGKLYTTTYK